MKTKSLLSLVLALLATSLLSSCVTSSSHGRGDNRSGGMSSWERSRR